MRSFLIWMILIFPSVSYAGEIWFFNFTFNSAGTFSQVNPEKSGVQCEKYKSFWTTHSSNIPLANAADDFITEGRAGNCTDIKNVGGVPDKSFLVRFICPGGGGRFSGYFTDKQSCDVELKTARKKLLR